MNGDSAVEDQIEVTKTESNSLTVKGEGDVKYCEVYIDVPVTTAAGKSTTTKKTLKDSKTACDADAVAFSFTIPIEGMSDEDLSKEHKLYILGYDKNKKGIDSKIVSIKIAEGVTGEASGSAGAVIASFEINDGLRNVIPEPDKEYTTDSSFVDIFVHYNGDWDISIATPSGGTDKRTNADCVGGVGRDCSKDENIMVIYEFMEYGKYTFTFNYKEGSDMKADSKKYMINSVKELGGMSS